MAENLADVMAVHLVDCSVAHLAVWSAVRLVAPTVDSMELQKVA